MGELDLREKCKEMSDFFLPVFEDYWMSGWGKFYGDVVDFCMHSYNMSFQMAFAVANGLLDLCGLTPRGREYIEDNYDAMRAGIQEGQPSGIAFLPRMIFSLGPAQTSPKAIGPQRTPEKNIVALTFSSE